MIKYCEFAITFDDENNLLLFFDAETWKLRYRIGLDTLLVCVVNYEYKTKNCLS